jgi:hypothetical protein
MLFALTACDISRTTMLNGVLSLCCRQQIVCFAHCFTYALFYACTVLLALGARRSQLWQWVRHGAKTTEGKVVTADLVNQLLQEEVRACCVPLRCTCASIWYCQRMPQGC